MNDTQFHCFISALAVIYTLLRAYELHMTMSYMADEPK